jgi:hypothetical protein
MVATPPQVDLIIGDTAFAARLRTDASPFSCRILREMMPIHREVVHARWSGEAIWSPLSAIWPAGLILSREREIHSPNPGDVLLFGGELSEPELLICYGTSRFACKAGPLAGNLVLTISSRLDRLSELGAEILRHGQMRLQIS